MPSPASIANWDAALSHIEVPTQPHSHGHHPGVLPPPALFDHLISHPALREALATYAHEGSKWITVDICLMEMRPYPHVLEVMVRGGHGNTTDRPRRGQFDHPDLDDYRITIILHRRKNRKSGLEAYYAHEEEIYEIIQKVQLAFHAADPNTMPELRTSAAFERLVTPSEAVYSGLDGDGNWDLQHNLLVAIDLVVDKKDHATSFKIMAQGSHLHTPTGMKLQALERPSMAAFIPGPRRPEERPRIHPVRLNLRNSSLHPWRPARPAALFPTTTTPSNLPHQEPKWSNLPPLGAYWKRYDVADEQWPSARWKRGHSSRRRR